MSPPCDFLVELPLLLMPVTTHFSLDDLLLTTPCGRRNSLSNIAKHKIWFRAMTEKT